MSSSCPKNSPLRFPSAPLVALLLALLAASGCGRGRYLAQVAPYSRTVAGPANWGPSHGELAFEALFASHTNRIRQDGTLVASEIFLPSTNRLVSLQIKVWRKSPDGALAPVGETENLAPRIKPGVARRLKWKRPIRGIREGDYYGLRATFSGASEQNFFADTNSVSLVQGDPVGLAPVLNASTARSVPGAPLFQLFMAAPDIIFIGDSVMSGRTNSVSYADYFYATVHEDDPAATTPRIAGRLLRATYQNVAISGQTTARILARFQRDVIDQRPKIAVIEGGNNDVFRRVPAKAIVANLAKMANLCLAAGIKPVFVCVYPFHSTMMGDYGSPINCSTADEVNSRLLAFPSQFPGCVVADSRPAIGRFSVDGPSGNYWSLAPEADSGDGVHLTARGHAANALAIVMAIDPKLAYSNSISISSPSR
jgi:lysophospholipase L1-like esterase